jgi:DNA invertase Pin-like site-specific DNA recombinase
MAKRVYCLYRVSTKGQVEKDDIPMQKQRCHEFAEEKGWEIVQEFSEKGVSGFKVSAKDRDAIQEIQRDAAVGKFDILLVFMFDRLGRKEDETPFVVEWFVQNGIEVWSAEEGQQRFDNHVDKLMNYIRYWQASGESLKTSVRTKTRLGQIVQEGRFRGGSAPYGYQLVKKGRIGKRNRELYDIEINPTEAIAIREIFNQADQFGYGGRRISSELKAKGIINERTGEPFHYSSIQNFLQNIMYMGILRSGETKSEIFMDLQIITPEQFERVKKGRQQRSLDYEAKCNAAWQKDVTLQDGTEVEVDRPPRMVPRRNVGKSLLSGNVY